MDHIYNYLSKNLIYKERLQKKEKKKKKDGFEEIIW